MSDTVQNIEDLIERLVNVDGAVRKLKTTSVSGTALRKQAKDIHKAGYRSAGIASCSWRTISNGSGPARLRSTENWPRNWTLRAAPVVRT